MRTATLKSDPDHLFHLGDSPACDRLRLPDDVYVRTRPQHRKGYPIQRLGHPLPVHPAAKGVEQHELGAPSAYVRKVSGNGYF